MNGELYQAHLDRVSRSFAFCIRQLPTPLHEWVGLSYLLCRIVDTIEDSQWPNLEEHFAAFRAFDASLNDPDMKLGGWLSLFPESLPESEQLLIADAPLMIANLHHDLPPPVRDMIRELVLSMSQGMQHFCRQRHGDGSLRLHSLGEVNQYCFFVAGVVGELLAKLIARVDPRFRLSQLNILRAHHFGLFLQKVNLLKDQVDDEHAGRHLIPSREIVEASSEENASQALNFLLEVPKEQVEFRRFCAWSLFLGLEALSVARVSMAQQKVLKVPRAEMQNLLEQVDHCLDSDSGLRSLFDSFRARLDWPRLMDISRLNEFPDWVLRFYRGPLDTKSLRELGMTY